MRPTLLRMAALSALIATTASANPSDPLLTQVNNGSRSIAPTGFEENKGQVRTTAGEPAPYVRYRLTQGSTSIFLLNDGIAYQFNRMHYPEGYLELERELMHDPETEEQLDALRKQIRLETYRMDMVLEGANPDPCITTEVRSNDYTNYYTHDVLDVRSYTRITYHDVYPGIDWVVYTNANGLKYDFVVHPGADPKQIQLRFKHHEELRVDEKGRLIYGNRMGRFVEDRPVSFQGAKEVTTHFMLEGDRLTLLPGTYEPDHTLIIDPALSWGTYYGGTSEDFGASCAVDPGGNVYLAGYTSSTSSIANGGHQNTIIGTTPDAFLVKFDPTGIRLWGTYYGGIGYDYGYSCVVDPNTNVYLAGASNSASGIASGGHQDIHSGGGDAFLVKLTPDGIRLWGTYYGGAEHDDGWSCITDPVGNVYLAGITKSLTGIANGGHQDTFAGGANDAFLVKFDPTGTRLWGTYYGGASLDHGFSCAADLDGNVYIAGETWSPTGIAMGGHLNTMIDHPMAYLVKFDADGTRLWGTYYGGSGNDYGYSCAVEPNGNVYLSGVTYMSSGIASGGHQNTSGGLYDAFLVKFNAAGTRLWGTYYGGASDDHGYSCAIDPLGNVYLAGACKSSSAIASGGHQNTFGGGPADAFLVKFNAAGTRLWGTYFGGSNSDYGFCAIDPSGSVYLAGTTYSTSAIASAGHQNTFGGDNDAFLAKFEGAITTTLPETPTNSTTSAIPSPTNGLVVVTTSATGQRYAITDAAGRMVLEGVLLARTTQVDLSSEPAGVYLLKVWDGVSTEVLRIVKE